MILQALKNMYPKASEKVLRAVMKDLEKCRGKNMSTEELADWIGKLVTAHTIEEAIFAYAFKLGANLMLETLQ